jgi:hypothetical protein
MLIHLTKMLVRINFFEFVFVVAFYFGQGRFVFYIFYFNTIKIKRKKYLLSEKIYAD